MVWLLGAGIVAMLAADVGFNLVQLRGDLTFLAAFGRIPLYGAAGLVAQLPSMRQLTKPVPPAGDLSRVRLALLAVASLIAPIVLVARVPVDEVIAGLSAVTFLLVLGRMAGIMASHRLALARERGLREASAALVSAAGPDEVGVAVRTAVAQLLPNDVPHGVVLAMAIAQPDEPLPGPQAAQADHDRAHGTAARLTPTRDVDWAVAVRLTQFNMVLRCPLVLRDRPTGDPLVGVLHVGAPTWALLGLAADAGGARLAGGAGAGADRTERGGHPPQQRDLFPYARAEHVRRHRDRRRGGPDPVCQPVGPVGARR